MGTTLWGLPMYLFGFFCLFLMLGYVVQWPRPKAGQKRPFWLHLLLRWGHAAVWLLLAAACFLWYAGYNPLGNQLAANAMIVYIIFIVALFYDRRAAKG